MPPCLVHWFFKPWYHHIQTHMWVWSSIPQKGIPNIMGYKNITYIHTYIQYVVGESISISICIYIYIFENGLMTIPQYIGNPSLNHGNPSRLLELLGDDPSIGNQLQRQFGHLGTSRWVLEIDQNFYSTHILEFTSNTQGYRIWSRIYRGYHFGKWL